MLKDLFFFFRNRMHNFPPRWIIHLQSAFMCILWCRGGCQLDHCKQLIRVKVYCLFDGLWMSHPRPASLSMVFLYLFLIFITSCLCTLSHSALSIPTRVYRNNHWVSLGLLILWCLITIHHGSVGFRFLFASLEKAISLLFHPVWWSWLGKTNHSTSMESSSQRKDAANSDFVYGVCCMLAILLLCSDIMCDYWFILLLALVLKPWFKCQVDTKLHLEIICLWFHSDSSKKFL